jgi:hypothetical protein
MSVHETLAILGSVPATSNRLIMFGVLATLKTMRGQQNKWPNRYPAIEKVAEIFPVHSHALNLIHYNTKEPETLTEQLIEMTSIGGENLHGFQLNIAWPTIDSLTRFRWAHPDKQIVLQIGSRAFEMVGNSAEQLADRVAEYRDLVEYALVDPSGGYGKPFDPKRARECLTALKAKSLGLGLGVAGGLSPTTLNLVQSLVSEFPDLSIDAEGRLRDGNDRLDLAIAKEYLSKSLDVFSSN